MFKHATMNRAYRLVWSELHRTWVAVAEFARTRGKRASGVLAASAVLALGASAAMAAGDPSPTALPTGDKVIAGQVSISSSGVRMDVDQKSNSAIVGFDTFNIGSQARVDVAQPDASSVILFRVSGGEGSSIFGRLTANGQVFLTDSRGILFAPGAQVDVGGLVASSLGISDANFRDGKYNFLNEGGAGSVVNHGNINVAKGGFVALIAPKVSNSGTINATGGSIGLAAGDSVNLDFDHDGMLSFQVNLPAAAALAENTGVLIADGGRVVMNAQAKDALLSTVLNNDNVIRAHSLESRNGEIWLNGGSTGVVSVTGTLDASGTEAGQTGGSVKVLGDKVGLFGHARIDVSGVGAGGTALVGGNFQGKGPEQNASMTFLDKDVTINADAVGRGNGGKVIVWANDITRYYGGISAKGGAQSGDGGFAEVSGKENLVFRGTADLTASNGKGGRLLLDPRDLVIDGGAANAGGGVTTDDAIVGDTVAFLTNTGADTTITETTLEAIAANSTIDLQAENSITLGGTAFTAGLTFTNNTSVTFRTRNNTGDDNGSVKSAGIDLAGVAIAAQGTGSLTFNTSDAGTGAGTGGTGAYTPTIQLGSVVLGSGTLSVNTTAGTGTTQGAITLNGGVTTAGGIVAFTGPVLLGASLTVDTTNAGGTAAGANITFNGTVNGANDLTLDAGAGATNFNAAVGAGTPLGDGVGAALTINSTGATNFNDTLATASGLTQAGTAGEVTFKKNVTLAAGDTATTLNGNVTLDQAAGLFFQAARSITFGDAATDQVTLSGGPVSISTTANSGVLAFNSKVDGAQNLTVGTNGTGTINFNGVVGGVTPIGNLTAVAGGAITFGVMTVNGYIDAMTTGGSITQTGVLSISGDLWVKTNAGSIDFYSSGMSTLGGAVSLIDASLSNEVKLSADAIKVGTTRPSNGSILDADTGIQGARVTIKAPSGAAILANGTQGLITADAPFDTAVAALTIDTRLANGNVGDPLTATPKTVGLRVHTSGLVVVFGQAAGDGTIMLVGDDAVQPKYKESGDPNFRPVMYNGVQATNAQLTGALDAAYLDIRNLTTEIRESGFAKENASKVLRRGVVTSAGPGQPAVDDSTGLAGLELCDGTYGNSALACQ